MRALTEILAGKAAKQLRRLAEHFDGRSSVALGDKVTPEERRELRDKGINPDNLKTQNVLKVCRESDRLKLQKHNIQEMERETKINNNLLEKANSRLAGENTILKDNNKLLHQELAARREIPDLRSTEKISLGRGLIAGIALAGGTVYTMNIQNSKAKLERLQEEERILVKNKNMYLGSEESERGYNKALRKKQEELLQAHSDYESAHYILPVLKKCGLVEVE